MSGISWTYTTITIQDAVGSAEVPAETHPDAPGLAVRPDDLSVTHLASGMCAARGCPDLATARWAALALAGDGLDWTPDLDQLGDAHRERAVAIRDRIERIPPMRDVPPLPTDDVVLYAAGALYFDALRRMADSPDYSYVCDPHTLTWEAIVHLRAAIAGTSYPEAEDWLRERRCKDESEVERLRREVDRG